MFRRKDPKTGELIVSGDQLDIPLPSSIYGWYRNKDRQFDNTFYKSVHNIFIGNETELKQVLTILNN